MFPPRDYKDYSTDSAVRFVVTLSEDNYRRADDDGFHKFFKLQTFIQSSMVSSVSTSFVTLTVTM